MTRIFYSLIILLSVSLYLILSSCKKDDNPVEPLDTNGTSGKISTGSTVDDQIRTSLNQPSPPLQLTATYIHTIQKIKTQSFLVRNIFLHDKELRLVFPKSFRNAESTEISNLNKLHLQDN